MDTRPTHALKGTTARKKKQAKGGLLTIYYQVLNLLLKTYATNENISRSFHEISLYKQPEQMTHREYEKICGRKHSGAGLCTTKNG